MIFTETTEAVEPDDRLNGVLAAYLEALAGGEQPLQSDWLQQHPDFAVELREFFECWDAISELARPLRETQAILRTLTPPPQHVPTDSRPVETSAGPPSFYSPLPQDYELLEEMGRGGMGVVYKARYRKLNRIVALKMIRDGRLAADSEVRRFQKEAEAVVLFDHPHIVPIFDVGEYEGRAWFTMKFVEGGSLADSLDPFTNEPRRAAELMVKIARAVDHAHQRGILHRDPKPSNVLLDGAGQPHVTDFGLARQLATESTLTGTGEMVGTPSYMSPEQASGKRQAITVATDVYGLGTVLYALLTGRPPLPQRFRHRDAEASLRAEPARAARSERAFPAIWRRSASRRSTSPPHTAIRPPPHWPKTCSDSWRAGRFTRVSPRDANGSSAGRGGIPHRRR